MVFPAFAVPTPVRPGVFGAFDPRADGTRTRTRLAPAPRLAHDIMVRMANALSDHLRGRKLVGRAWIESDERFRIEYRRMRRRVPMYRVAIGALRLLHRLTATERQKQADLGVTWWPRVGPDGEMYAMPKLWTIDEREPTDKQTPGPPRTEAELYRRWEAGEWSEPKNGAETRTTGSPAELRRVASFAARLARTVSGDEWPQIIHEYERRKAILAQLRAGVVPEGNRYVESGAVPPGVRPPLHGWARYQWVGDRPLDLVSDRLMDRSWVLGRTPARQYQPWSAGRVAYPGAYFGPMFGELGRTVVGGEANPEFLSLRVAYGVWWGQNASMKGRPDPARGADGAVARPREVRPCRGRAPGARPRAPEGPQRGAEMGEPGPGGGHRRGRHGGRPVRQIRGADRRGRTCRAVHRPALDQVGRRRGRGGGRGAGPDARAGVDGHAASL